MSEAFPAVRIPVPATHKPKWLVAAACATVLAAAAAAGVTALGGGEEESFSFPAVVRGTSLTAVPLYAVSAPVRPGEAAPAKLGEPVAELRADYARVRPIRTGGGTTWEVELSVPEPPALPATAAGPRLAAVYGGRAYIPLTVQGSDGINFALLGGKTHEDALAVAMTLTTNVLYCGDADPAVCIGTAA